MRDIHIDYFPENVGDLMKNKKNDSIKTLGQNGKIYGI